MRKYWWSVPGKVLNQRLIVIVLVVVLILGLAGCGGGGDVTDPMAVNPPDNPSDPTLPSDPANPSGPPPLVDSSAVQLATTLKAPFSTDSSSAAAQVMQKSGLVIVEDDGSPAAVAMAAAIRSTNELGSGLGLFRIQTRALALEIAGQGGQLGSALDAVTPRIPLPPDGSGVDKQVSFSLLVAAYVKHADSFGAQVARELMGEIDLTKAAEYRYPTLILYSFMQEALIPLLAESESLGISAANYRPNRVMKAAFDPADPCGSVNSFLDDLPGAVSGAVSSLGADSSGVWSTVFSWAGTVAGVATSIATEVALEVVRNSPSISAIRNAMTAVHAAADLNAMFSQWAVEVTPTPPSLHKTPGSPDSGTFNVTLNNGGGSDGPTWPDAVKNCADLFNIPLPDFNSADGATVTWTPIAGFGELATPVDETNVLASNKAEYNFDATSEDRELHENPNATTTQGTVIVEAKVALPGLENLMSKLASTLTSTAGTVVNGATTPAANLAGLTKRGEATVEYHSLQQARINAITLAEQLQATACNGVQGDWIGTLTRTDPVAGSGSAPVSWSFGGGVSTSLDVSVSMNGGVLGASGTITISETLQLQGDAVSGYSIQTSGQYTQVTNIPNVGPVSQPGQRMEGYTIELGSFAECQ